MTFDTSDAISVTDIRNRLHDLAQENLVFRAAFQQLQVPDGTDNQWQIPIDEDVLAEPDEVAEGSHYPTDKDEADVVTFTRTKYGQAIPVTDEAIMDNIFPLISWLVDKQGRAFQERLDSEAFGVLNADNNDTSADTGTTMSYDLFLEAKRILRDGGYNPDLCIIEAQGEEQLLGSDDVTPATEFGDAVIEEGELGRLAGVDILVSNTGDLGANTGFMVDTSFYGAEAVWVGMEMEQVDERLEDTTYLKARTFRDWQALDDQAAVEMDPT